MTGAVQAAPGKDAQLLTVEELIDRALASARLLATDIRRAARSVQGASAPRMAPETTGRTAHAVDERADLYTLGAALYEWATGRPAFEERDPLKLVHEQLTRVPLAPCRLRPDLPAALSGIILRLLEKDPSQRYNGPSGLIYDLERLKRALRRGRPLAFPLGERDFPARLCAPAVPLGREAEIAALEEALQAASRGECRTLLVCGAAGTGKTALVNQLRPLATVWNARFAVGNFDPFGRKDPAGVVEAMGALAGSLLTEPDDVLAAQRQRILRELGHEAVLATVIPEFAVLLGELPRPAPSDPTHANARLMKLVAGLLRSIASAARPVVFVLDGLQWSRVSLVRLLENLSAEGGVPGLVLIGVYRTGELPPSHPLAATIGAWRRRQPGVRVLETGNLGHDTVAQMLAHMLRVPARRTQELARLLAEHTNGNPHDTVEVVNALRQEGLLVAHASGWRWNADALQRYVSAYGRADPLAGRIARLAPDARELLATLACLGTEIPVGVAAAASGLAENEFRAGIEALAREGLVLDEDSPRAVLKLRQDRIQKAAYASVPGSLRAELHLSIARRLTAQAFAPFAALQYLEAKDALYSPAECIDAARRLAAEARRAAAVSNNASAQRMLEAALDLIQRAEAAGRADGGLRSECESDLHHTLCARGRLGEADAVYADLERRETDPLRYVSAACVQVSSLNQRGHRQEAVALGMHFVRRLGVDVPQHFELGTFAGRFAQLRGWLSAFDVQRELARPETKRAEVLAAATMFNRLGAPVFHADIGLVCWLVFSSWQLWKEEGPCAELAATIALASVISGEFDDVATGVGAGRKLLALCEARGWPRAASQSRFLLATCCLPWTGPLETAVPEALRAKDEMLAAGELEHASFCYRTVTVGVFETSPSLDAFAHEVHEALDLARQAGNAQTQDWYVVDEQLLGALRGEGGAAGSLEFGEFCEAAYLARNQANAMVLLGYHLRRAICCAIFGLPAPLADHAGAAAGLVRCESFYSAMWSRWMLATSLAWQIQLARDPASGPQERMMVELDRCIDWIAARANAAPANFAHMHAHACGERAWALGDARGARLFFEQALRCLGTSSRPWHRAFITERAARLHLAQGRARGGREMLAEALHLYRSWGATAKAAQLGAAPPQPGAQAARAEGVEGVGWKAADELDTLAVLRASQALSSERNAGQLRSRVKEVVGSIMGATGVVLALWDEDENDWMVDDAQGRAVSIARAKDDVPLSAFRYAERTREPLLLADAPADDRFAGDPYFRGIDRCSLMLVPILHQGALRAMLVLENRASRGAFTTARLDAIMMIAGQLAVSLENAQLYERLERKVREQTQQLREAQSRLLAEAHRAGMAQIATNVLHNVGNVLNNVNVSTHVLSERVRQSRSARVADLARLLQQHSPDLGHFLEKDERGKLLPAYVRDLAAELEGERDDLLAELARLGASVEHIKNVVAMQQSHAGASGVREPARITDLIDDALRIQEDGLAKQRVEVRRDYADVGTAALDKTRVMQILVNLIENARHAMRDADGRGTLDVSVKQEEGAIDVRIADSGCGIAPENIERIFAHGFTTKPDGHGFGLHSCALAAREMGGSIAVYSEGQGRGATFVLRLPASGAN